MSITANAWYLIYTRPRHERKVSESLSEDGIDNFLPTIKQLRNWSDRKKYIDSPLFPSYIFVRLRNVAEYYNSLKAEGALYYVKFGSSISRVSESVIDGIRMLLDTGAPVEVSSQCFQPSQQLIISDGPFTGMSCEVVEFKGKEKILVRVNLLRQNLLATLPVRYMKTLAS